MIFHIQAVYSAECLELSPIKLLT